MQVGNEDVYDDQSSELTNSEHGANETGFRGDQKTSDLQSEFSKDPPKFDYNKINKDDNQINEQYRRKNMPSQI